MQTGRLSGVDIFKETDLFSGVAKRPGVQKDDISVDLQKISPDIVAHTGARPYLRHIDLGIPVKDELVINGNNGILEIISGKVQVIMRTVQKILRSVSDYYQQERIQTVKSNTDRFSKNPEA